jgi:hypothetical protein
VVVEWCCMCKKSGQSIDHLLLHCEVAGALWNYMYFLFGIELVMPRRVLDFWTGWGGSFGGGLVKEIWRLVPLSNPWL